jgi:integrase
MHTYVMTTRGLTSTTALQAHRVLAKALKDAEREGLVTRNVATLVDAPRKAVNGRQALTTAHARAILTAAEQDPLAARWALALLYGVRQGEALGLTWACVDLDAGTIDLAWQLQRLTWRHGCGEPTTCGRKRGAECPQRHIGAPPGFEVQPLDGARCLTRPKSKAGTRVLPLIEPMRVLLERQAALTAGEPNPHGLVWHEADGRPLDSKDDRAAWYGALEAAGAPRVELHGARHTTATLLLELGIDAAVIASILGHSDVVTTRGYQHVDLSLSRAAVESLGRVLTTSADPATLATSSGRAASPGAQRGGTS